jgi:peptidoglycan/xylan/chitin deacetylase (PgdA/CDA1 family)
MNNPKPGKPGAETAKEKYVTISVDDGHPTDLRTVDLLHKYGLTATFYIPGARRR